MTTPGPEALTDRVSKVSFNPVSDSTGNQTLIVATPKPETISPESIDRVSKVSLNPVSDSTGNQTLIVATPEPQTKSPESIDRVSKVSLNPVPDSTGNQTLIATTPETKSPIPEPIDRVSKVSFNPVSDSTGNQALIVTTPETKSPIPEPIDRVSKVSLNPVTDSTGNQTLIVATPEPDTKSPIPEPIDRVSKVSFNPVSDSTGNQALIVTIRSVVPQPEDIPKAMERTRRSMSFDSKKSETKRKTRSRNQGNSKSTMTEPMTKENQGSGSTGDVSGSPRAGSGSHGVVSHSPGIASSSPGAASVRSGDGSGLSLGSGSPGVDSGSTGIASSSSGAAFVPSGAGSGSPGNDSSPSKSVPKVPGFTDAPCLKHAAENISRKASDMQSEKMSLCNNCSKSMLSYIFVVQDFLESLAKEIVGQSDSLNCIQCLREETRKSVSGIKDDAAISGNKKTSKIRNKDVQDSKREEHGFPEKESNTRTKTSSREVRRYEETSDQLIERSLAQHRQTRQQDRENFQSSNLQGNTPSNQQGSNQDFQSSSQNDQINHKGVDQQMLQDSQGNHQSHMEPHQAQGYQNEQEGSHPNLESRQQANYQPYADEPTLDEQVPTRRPFNRHGIDHRREVESNVFGDANVDGVMSALSNAEREIYDEARNISGYEGMGEDGSRNNSGWESGARNNSGWENDARNISGSEDVARDNSGFGGMGEDSARNISGREGQRLVSSLPSPVKREAYVTTCRNNAEALGCLVVGTSLLLSRTNRTLCVLMSDGVSNAFKGPLSCVFHHVVSPKSLDALGSTKLSLLEQPELGVSFDKLNVWRLVQFDKCVYLNPDTLVLQNCDELFCRGELSAVSDVGWPDCFNSGVFVFVPSLQTFWDMVDHAEKNGSYDGGDQGLLNSYFNSWSEDITKKLSFIYNLMANVSYTYVPAFKQFGRNVKVVQFMGSSKPWHVKFFSKTGQISPDTPVHAMYAQFVHVWINIFRVAALRQLPQNIRSYAQSQEVISAVELLRFFPLPLESEADFFLTPPSVRMRRVERRLEASPATSKASQEARRRKSAVELPTSRPAAERQTDAKSDVESSDAGRSDVERDVGRSDGDKAVVTETNVGASDVGAEGPVDATSVVDADDVGLPGSAVGNYQGMKAWEQGRMDYQGTDSSDTIIKRLEFLMSQPK